MVSTKWNNMRDSWIKTIKKQKDESKSGFLAKKTRNYGHHRQLMFLKKVTEPRPPDKSVPKKARTEPEIGMEPSSAGNTHFHLPSKDKRKIDNKEVNDKMVKFLGSRINPEKEYHHLSLFKVIRSIKELTSEIEMAEQIENDQLAGNSTSQVEEGHAIDIWKDHYKLVNEKNNILTGQRHVYAYGIKILFKKPGS
ncbi:unnamed protein product, partial [Brenthis ino]